MTLSSLRELNNIIISMLEDKKGTMWFGTFMGGLNKMVGEKFKRYLPNVNNTNSLSNKSIYGLVEDHQQNIWIGTLGGGLDELDVTRQNFHHHVIGSTTGMSSNYVLSVYSKDSTNMYLSTSSGIDLLNSKTNSFTPVFKGLSQLNKLSDLIIYNSLIDRRNQLWLATDNGINVYNPKLNLSLARAVKR